ncbi:hypothetical protein GRF29_69g1986763 [Pseudopithomyces chartarum]|uniref:Major facilitator superfamily (MFS) profile domain-containing protein n=1 Tax=Pseudopithomyces chartarum TaxID=1892770 RepID=A0AAN6RHF0_9PLEO|nr:hypothetical protein GRF29_69g1986763 [Pseudopithomyces chartarum]
MADDQQKLEKTYSRESRLQRDGLEQEATPVALVRSVTQEHSRRDSRARIPTIYDIDIEAASDVGKGDEIKEISTPESGSVHTVPQHDVGAPERKTIRFEDGDPENPNNWTEKAVFLVRGDNECTMGSSLAAGAIKPISKHFGVTSEALLILPTSMYLLGYVGGPMIWGPLSESYGRKWVMIGSFAFFTVFAIASAVAPNFAALVVFRMMAATTFGPILGPPISGYISVISWSWAFWIGAIFAGVSWPLFFFFPETYGPVILKNRAQRLRKETGDESIIAPIELEKTDLHHILTTVLTRPVRMILFEPLVLFTCLYLSYAYAIFYIYFQSFPLIFIDIYHFNAGEEGLTFLPIGVGAIISAALYLTWDLILRRARAASKPWAQNEEMRRLPLACIAGPFFVISSFWLGWTARASIHWIVPCLASMLFGMGYLCLFMALLNYLVDAGGEDEGEEWVLSVFDEEEEGGGGGGEEGEGEGGEGGEGWGGGGGRAGLKGKGEE